MNNVIGSSDMQSVREVVCPLCNQPPGYGCRNPNGRSYDKVHTVRVMAYRDKIGALEFARRHTLRKLPFLALVSGASSRQNTKP